MTMENSGHKETVSQPNGQSSVPEQVTNPSRRRFNRAGIGASAVILTLTSRSVLAQSNTCASPSGFNSVKPSHDTQDLRCDALSADRWLDPEQQWPVSKDTQFGHLFGRSSMVFSPSTPSKFYDPKFYAPMTARDEKAAKSNGSVGNDQVTRLDEATLPQALKNPETHEVVKYLIVAYLNFRAGYTSYPTDLQAIAIFKEWQSSGQYTPTAGIKWSTQDILTYLEATQGRMLKTTRVG